MDFKYKIADVAKEFGVPTKKVIETVAPIIPFPLTSDSSQILAGLSL